MMRGFSMTNLANKLSRFAWLLMAGTVIVMSAFGGGQGSQGMSSACNSPPPSKPPPSTPPPPTPPPPPPPPPSTPGQPSKWCGEGKTPLPPVTLAVPGPMPPPKTVNRAVPYDLAAPTALTPPPPGVSCWYTWSPHPNSQPPANYFPKFNRDFY